ncbi:hypothetical protein HELRODRAFT_171914 [Helobdella robusta]|uniref:Apple domain-containing protein n=1 Tax=Helobdella robusta TaxID=6412 RepID=T1F4U5_HELRO|nr:hypothetical protein HELRODRAFT_171914 [Helobdella robusta]ESO04912.1 hypothetical protein HELRODRAFT_171914 [Helobdella robusta]
MYFKKNFCSLVCITMCSDLLLHSTIIATESNCFRKFEDGTVSFCSCDPAIEDRSWSTFSFLEALMLCSMRCSQTDSCVAYNFFNATNQCQLFNQTLNKFSVLPGCQYYYKRDKIPKMKQLLITVDDKLEKIYFNGMSISVGENFPHAASWDLPDTYDLSGNIFLVAVMAFNINGVGGILISTSDKYILTNETWKCTTTLYDGWYKIIYNDSAWPAAFVLEKHEFTSSLNALKEAGAEWITNAIDGENCFYYCRKSFIGTLHNVFTQHLSLLCSRNLTYPTDLHAVGFEEDNVSFCSCDHPYEDRSWSTFSFLEVLMLCSMRCSQTAGCVAYNFFSATNQCQLFNQTLNKFSVLPGCQYYLIKDGFIASTSDSYILTNETWKCTKNYYDGWYKINYNDSFWSAGSVIGNHEFSDGLKSLNGTGSYWTPETSNCQHCLYYCRKSFTELIGRSLCQLSSGSG